MSLFNDFLLNDSAKGRCLNMSGNKDANELLRWFEKEHGLKIKNAQKARSMMSPKFARNFIKMFVLSENDLNDYS